MTVDDMFRMAEVMEQHAERMDAEGFARIGAYLRDDARNLRAQAWEEVWS